MSIGELEKITLYFMILKYRLFLNKPWTKSTSLNEGFSERYLGLPIHKECRDSDKMKRYIHLSTYVRINRRKCVGRVIKMEVYRPSKEILEESFGGKRSVGRPRSGWEDKILKDTVSLLHIRNRKSLVPNRIGVRKMGRPWHEYGPQRHGRYIYIYIYIPSHAGT